MPIAVTGSSGKLGRAVVERLRADQCEVIGFDLAGAPGEGFTTVDLLDYGQVLDAFHGVTGRHEGIDALVHLAAIPVNGLVPDATTFHNNMTISFNVFHAALRVGIQTIIYASSITAMGFPFEHAPAALPVDESATEANNTYGLVKVLEEAMVAQLVRWSPTLSVTALRFTNVVAPGEYDTFARASDPGYRRDLIGTYIDARDGATAVALALEAAEPGLEIYNIAAPESGLDIPSVQVAADWFPGTPFSRPLEKFESLVDTRKAQSRLGFRAKHHWREEFAGRS